MNSLNYIVQSILSERPKAGSYFHRDGQKKTFHLNWGLAIWKSKLHFHTE